MPGLELSKCEPETEAQIPGTLASTISDWRTGAPIPEALNSAWRFKIKDSGVLRFKIKGIGCRVCRFRVPKPKLARVEALYLGYVLLVEIIRPSSSR